MLVSLVNRIGSPSTTTCKRVRQQAANQNLHVVSPCPVRQSTFFFPVFTRNEQSCYPSRMGYRCSPTFARAPRRYPRPRQAARLDMPCKSGHKPTGDRREATTEVRWNRGPGRFFDHAGVCGRAARCPTHIHIAAPAPDCGFGKNPGSFVTLS